MSDEVVQTSKGRSTTAKKDSYSIRRWLEDHEPSSSSIDEILDACDRSFNETSDITILWVEPDQSIDLQHVGAWSAECK
ncbi:hypothetical protein AJ80_06442 [Polytolypa hystricis UAMH7299]|uniref:Uncharacterized protein n=1 Tax=Polytolypa hystricis (strain UAMH7299) TaxID=1447883 RepID=A0A2B7XVG4_POLH7|nr:hypothetical protein AJ80_06442 [Polytolypa hystricis UAMH7299]